MTDVHTPKRSYSAPWIAGLTPIVGVILALACIVSPLQAASLCTTHLSRAKGLMEQMGGATTATVTWSQDVDEEMRGNGAHDRFVSFLINFRNRLGARCEDPKSLEAPTYHTGDPVPVGQGAKVVFAVHQSPEDSGKSAAISNIAGVDRVVNQLGASDLLYVMSNRNTYNASRRTATGHLGSQTALNFQSSSRPLIVVGGNFDASMPTAVRKVISGFRGSNLNLDFPADASYLKIHGFSLQQVYDYTYHTNQSLFENYLRAVIDEQYAAYTTAHVRLYLLNEGDLDGVDESGFEPLMEIPAIGSDPRTVDFRVFIQQPNPCDLVGDDAVKWKASQYYKADGSFSKTEVGSVDTDPQDPDSCTVTWGQHTPISGATLCRYTKGAPGDRRITVWGPIGTGTCPTTATVYKQTSGPIVVGSEVDFVFNITQVPAEE